MDYDISQPVPQGGDGAQDAENSRIAAIANELERLCAVHETQHGDSQADVSRFETEQRAAEQMAKANGYWIPMMDVFGLGVPGPSGNENDTYVAEKVIYKVNNLLNSGSIVGLLRKILMHNLIFPDTAYRLYGFAGFDGRTVQPVIIQPRVADAHPATQVMIAPIWQRWALRRLQLKDAIPTIPTRYGTLFLAMSSSMLKATSLWWMLR